MTTDRSPEIQQLEHAALLRLRKEYRMRDAGAGKFDALCPAHEDHNRSLRVYRDDTGRLHFRCYAGCHFNDVRRALGLPEFKGAPGRAAWRPLAPRLPRTQRYDFPAMAERFTVRAEVVEALAEELGVSSASLVALGVGHTAGELMWVESRGATVPINAWVFPMKNAAAEVTGLRLRFAGGVKRAWVDSEAGVFLPERWHMHGPVLIVEGPTDAATALDWGFDVIGKPSCNSGDAIVIALLRAIRRDVVILSNLDDAKPKADGTVFYPGQDGAEVLANELVHHCSSVKVITPPSGIKDGRKWKGEGGTRRDVDEVIASKRKWRTTKRRSA